MREGRAFGPLLYLYVGTRDFDADHALYRDAIGAEEVWHFARFGARVAAFRISEAAPLVLLADHRPAPSCLPIYGVDDLEREVARLRARGFEPEGQAFEVPDGSCCKFVDRSGNAFALLQVDRPGAMERAYADPENAYAVRHY